MSRKSKRAAAMIADMTAETAVETATQENAETIAAADLPMGGLHGLTEEQEELLAGTDEATIEAAPEGWSEIEAGLEVTAGEPGTTEAIVEPATVQQLPETTEPMMSKVASDQVMLQPRTLLVPKPAFFFFEPNKAKRDAESEQQENAIERGPHQVDPNRFVSCAPVMPNLALMRETGNPYPSSGEHETVVTLPKYRPYAVLSRFVFEALKAAERDGKKITSTGIVKQVCEASGIGLTAKTKEPSLYAQHAVFDTLRDLRNYGLVEGSTAIARMKKTEFGLVTDWMETPVKGEDDAREQRRAMTVLEQFQASVEASVAVILPPASSEEVVISDEDIAILSGSAAEVGTEAAAA